jgi:hypothetical protein
MTRLMGDTIHDNVNVLVARGDLQLIAGYDTGTPNIQWVPTDWSLFPDEIHIHIDQAFGDTRVKEAHVLVFDIESGAFRPDQAAALIDTNQSSRPTIYVNRDNMAATVASARQSKNWRGDIWLACPGWKPGQPLPPIPPGTRYVAIQDVFARSYDLSTVLDDSWPNPLDESPDWRDNALSMAIQLGSNAAALAALIKRNTP